MADISELEQSFVTIVAQTLFPSTSYTPYNVSTSSLLGISCRVYRGWPLDQQLSDDMNNNVTNISIFSSPGLARDTTRFLRRMTETVTQVYTPTMTITKVGNQITFAGTPSTTEVIGIAHRHAGFSYRLSLSDTPASVAAAFAAHIPNSTAVANVLTINVDLPITVTVGGDVATETEVHRQEQLIRVITWAPTTSIRDQVCSALDPAIMWTDRIQFQDNFISGPIINAGTYVDDVVGIENLWRRDLIYKVEYATTFKQILPPYVLGETTGPVKVFV